MPQTSISPSRPTPELEVRKFAEDIPGPTPGSMEFMFGTMAGDMDRRFGDESYLSESAGFFRPQDQIRLDRSARSLYDAVSREEDQTKRQGYIDRLKRYEEWRRGSGDAPYEYILREKQSEKERTFDRGSGVDLLRKFTAGPDHVHELLSESQRTVWEESYRYSPDPTADKRKAMISGVISHWTGKGADEVGANYDAYKQAFYSHVLGVQGTADDAKIYSETTKWLKRRTEQAENIEMVQQRAYELVQDSVIRGEGAEDAVRSVTDELVGEFGEDAIDRGLVSSTTSELWKHEVRKSAPYIQEARRIYELAKSSIDDPASRSTSVGFKHKLKRGTGRVAVTKSAKSSEIEQELRAVAGLNRQDRRQLLHLIHGMARQDAGELEGGVGAKASASLFRGVVDYVDNQLDALEKVGEIELETSSISTKDLQKRKIEYERNLREFRQDLRDIPDIVREIKSDIGFVQGIYDAARSVPYTAMAAAGRGIGIGINAMAMATQEDIQLRHKYPDMSPDLRWTMASTSGLGQSLIERGSFVVGMGAMKALKPFPRVTGYLKKAGARGTAATAAFRTAAFGGAEYTEEAFQEVTTPSVQSFASLLNEEVPEVTTEEWGEYTRIFRGDARTAWAVLPLAVLMGGGKTAIDRMGAGRAAELLSSVDNIRLAGATEASAIRIAQTSDPLKAQAMLKNEIDGLSDEEIRKNQDEALADGALDSVIRKSVEESGSEVEKDLLKQQDLYRPRIEKVPGGEFKLIYPESDTRPSEFFPTRQEAFVAADAYATDKINDEIDAMATSVENIEAMQMAKEHLEAAHEGAEIEITRKTKTIEDAVDEGAVSMDQMIARAEISNLEHSIEAAESLEDLKSRKILGDNQIRESARGYVARIYNGADVSTVFEEGAEGFIKNLVRDGAVSPQWLEGQLRQYQLETGDKLFKDVDRFTPNEAIEGFAKLARANLLNKQDDLPRGLSRLVNALREFFATVVRTAENLLRLKGEGKLDGNFELILDQAVGLNMDQQIERQAAEFREGLFDDLGPTFSISKGEDTVLAKIRELEKDPEALRDYYSEVYKRLRAIRKTVYSQAGDIDHRTVVINGIAQLQAITSVLPAEIRSKVGGWKKIAGFKTFRGVDSYLRNRLDLVDRVMDGYLRGQYIKKVDNLIKKSKPGKSGKMPKGKITPEGHTEIGKIESVISMSDKELADELHAVNARTEKIQGEPDSDKMDDLEDRQAEDLARLMKFGKMKSKDDPMDLTSLVDAVSEIESIIKGGRAKWNEVIAQRRAEVIGHRNMVKEVVSGGLGRVTRAQRVKRGDPRKRSVIKDLLSKAHYKNISFEWMLNALSRKDTGSGTLESKISKRYARKVHRATHGEVRAVAEKLFEIQKEFARIHGIDTGKKSWLGKTEDAMLEHSEIKYNSGIFLVEGVKSKSIKATRLDLVPVLDGTTDLIKDGMSYIRLSKEEIAEFRGLVEEADKASSRRKNFSIVRKTEGRLSEQPVSQDTAMFLSMMWEQPGLRPAMEAHGYNEESMKQYERFLTDESKELREWLFAKYEGNYDYFNETFERMTGVTLPRVQGRYSPAKSIHGGRQVKDMIDAGQRLSTTPGLAMERIQHLAEPVYDVGALDAYKRHVESTEHYVHWAEIIREMRSVFMDKSVREMILDHAGKPLYDEVVSRIDILADGGNVNANVGALLDRLRKTFTVAKLSYNWGVFAKQLTSLPAYAYDIPLMAYFRYEAEFMRNPVKNFKKMRNLPYVRERLKRGHERDVIMALNTSMEKRGKIEKAADFGMIGVKAGDIMPVIIGGYSAYRYAEEQALSKGKSEEEAANEAVLAFEMSTDRSQQSGELKDQSAFQLGGSFYRVATMFQTSPRQYFSQMGEAIADAYAGRKGARKRAAKAIVITHVVLPSLFYWMSAFARNALRDEDERDSWADMKEDWITSMVLGPYTGLFLVGQAMNQIFTKYDYGLPVLEWSNSLGYAYSGSRKMLKDALDDDESTNIMPEDVIKVLNDLATATSLGLGKGWTMYDIATRAFKSFGVTEDDVIREVMSEVDGQVHDLSEARNKLYREKLPDKEKFPYEHKRAQRERYVKLAGEYRKSKERHPGLWGDVSDKLREKGKLPKDVEKMLR